ncbi:Protein singed [Eumeta japonica]|uniref:Protein singed n=1 Tax=Eumeta variegata TaxID=151549 RepID=A0A4C1UXS6_EUMVA|nr:Protein singed [Eumeta japonica]
MTYGLSAVAPVRSNRIRPRPLRQRLSERSVTNCKKLTGTDSTRNSRRKNDDCDDRAHKSMIYLRSHLDKYLAVDSFGNVTCESEEKEPGSKFHIRSTPGHAQDASFGVP